MVKTLQKLYVFAVSSEAYQNCLSAEEQAQFAEDIFEIMDCVNSNSPPAPPPEKHLKEREKNEAQ